MRRGPGPHVTWAGVVVKLSDGTTHALEFPDDRTTADIKFNPATPGYSSVWIQGRARHWTEGADTAPRVEQRELPPGRSELESGN